MHIQALVVQQVIHWSPLKQKNITLKMGRGTGRGGGTFTLDDNLKFDFEDGLIVADEAFKAEERELMRQHANNPNLNKVVCTYWLKGRCKKGVGCEYLHRLDPSRMPECQFWSKFGACAKGEDCPYKHTDKEGGQKECPW